MTRKIDKTKFIFGLIICAIYVGFIYVLANHPIPEENKITFDAAFGGISTVLIMVFTYFFGSSEGSAKKTDALVDRVNSDKHHEDSVEEFLNTDTVLPKHKE